MDPATDAVYTTKRTHRKEGEMEPNEIRERVSSIWLTTPESELLGCIALALADISESLEDIRQHLQVTQLDLRDHVVARELQPL